MSHIRYPVPSHQPAGTQQVSRSFQALTAYPGVRVGIASQAQSNQGFNSRGVEPEFEQFRPSFHTFKAPPDLTVTLQATIAGSGSVTAALDVIRGSLYPAIAGGIWPSVVAKALEQELEQPPPSTAFFSLPLPLTLLDIQAVVQGQGSVAAELTVLAANRIGVALQGHSNFSLVQRQVPAPDIPGTETESALLFATTATQDLQVAVAGTSEVLPTLSVSAPTFIGIASAGHPSTSQIQQPIQQPVIPNPEPVSRLFTAIYGVVDLAASIAGQGVVSPTLFIPEPPVVPPPVLIQGHSNVQRVTRAPVPEGFPPDEPPPQSFVYYNAAPPIYRSIVPGTSNQHYTQHQYKAAEREQVFLSSRIIKVPFPPAGETINLQVAIAGVGAVAASCVLQQDLQVSISGTGAVSPQLVLQQDLQVAIAGQGALFAQFVLQQDLEVAISGTSQVLPTLGLVATGEPRRRKKMGYGL